MAISAGEVAEVTHLDLITALRVLKVARELVTAYGASAAPVAVVDEATIRICAYLGDPLSHRGAV